MSGRPPKNRIVQISLDANNQFHYEDLSDGTDASALVLIPGDSVSWVLDLAISPRTFQLDFDVVNPFQLGRPVSLRGTDSIAGPNVTFPFATYSGNRILKYTVSLGNGWSDDPDIVPSPGDPVIFTLGLQPSAQIAWVDPTTQEAINLNPTANLSADATDSGGRALVTLGWESNQPNPQSFTLQFEPDPQLGIPTGWPTTPQYSNLVNNNWVIQLSLPKGFASPTTFDLTTTTRDGNETSIQGSLLIT